MNRDSKAAFGRPPYSETSVNRYDRVNSAECTQAGNRRAEPINGAEGVLGWLIIPGDIAVRSGRHTKADPTSDNCYHAKHRVSGYCGELGGCGSAYAGFRGQRHVARRGIDRRCFRDQHLSSPGAPARLHSVSWF